MGEKNSCNCTHVFGTFGDRQLGTRRDKKTVYNDTHLFWGTFNLVLAWDRCTCSRIFIEMLSFSQENSQRGGKKLL